MNAFMTMLVLIVLLVMSERFSSRHYELMERLDRIEQAANR